MNKSPSCRLELSWGNEKLFIRYYQVFLTENQLLSFRTYRHS
jgi:hypothetical protein